MKTATKASSDLTPGRLARFWPKVDRRGDDECWLWRAGTDSDGYGRFWLGEGERRSIAAHRFAYMALVGPVPDGLELDHRCYTPACCNPAHMEPVTHQENSRRGRYPNRAKTKCRNGHPYDTANTYVNAAGHRQCRTCRRACYHRKKPSR